MLPRHSAREQKNHAMTEPTNEPVWQDFRYTSSDGLTLAGRKYGWEHRDALPAVCLPGLTRNAADFHRLAVHLSQHAQTPRRVLCLEYRGRGRSQYDKNWENYNVLTEADDVVQGMTAAGLQHAAMIGTSRGGLIIMLLAAMKPGLMAKIVLNDVGPEIDGAGLVRIKKTIESGSDAGSWKEAAEQLKSVGKRDFPNYSDEEWERQARLIYREDGGRLVRNYDPKLVNTLKALDLDTRLPSLWPQFTGLRKMPLMLIRGERTDLLSEQTVEKMQKIHSGMQIVNVPDQGHAPDLGSAGLPERIETFLAG